VRQQALDNKPQRSGHAPHRKRQQAGELQEQVGRQQGPRPARWGPAGRPCAPMGRRQVAAVPGGAAWDLCVLDGWPLGRPGRLGGLRLAHALAQQGRSSAQQGAQHVEPSCTRQAALLLRSALRALLCQERRQCPLHMAGMRLMRGQKPAASNAWSNHTGRAGDRLAPEGVARGSEAGVHALLSWEVIGECAERG